MRVLIVVPQQDRVSGNWVSAERFRYGLQQLGHQVALHATPLQAEGRLRRRLREFAPQVALLLHAYRAGQPWQEEAAGLGIPCVVLLTGTDFNHGLNDPTQAETIHAVLNQAAGVLVQNPLVAAGLAASHPQLAARLRLLPPGVVLGTAPYDLRASHGLDRQRPLFLCAAGVRPVKGLLELLAMCARLVTAGETFQLAFCGPLLDMDYSRLLLAALAKHPWASYLGTIAPQAMASAMRGADVILNNSQSEGLANALLEAAVLGLPILARDIPGNAAVVRHNQNGLLYADEQEFARYARELIDPARRHQLSRPETRLYQPALEAAELAAILGQVVKATGGL